MRKFVLFLLFAILTLGLLPSVNAAVTDVAVSRGVVSPAPDAGLEPGRDPIGEDNIFYDDNNPQFHFISGGAFTMVRFTPNSEFRLQAIQFIVYNVNAIAAGTKVRVCTVKQQNNGGVNTWVNDEELYVATVDGPFEDNKWTTHEIPEANWGAVTFQAGQDFGIIVGPNPGAPGEILDGWWLTVDPNSISKRSCLTWYAAGLEPSIDNEPDPAQMLKLDNNDCMIRANGTYINEFYDLAVTAAWNNDQKWAVIPGTSVTLIADIANYGADLGEAEYEVYWKVLDTQGGVAFDYTMAGVRVVMGDTLEDFVCDKTWDIPADAAQGRYTLMASTKILVADDTNLDNDSSGIDLFVFAPPKENPETWFEFSGQDIEGFTRNNMMGDSGKGWGVAYEHPGNDLAYRVTKVRAATQLNVLWKNPFRPGIFVGVLNFDNNPPLKWIHKQWFEIAPLVGAVDSLAWLEAELPADSGIFRKGDNIVIMYMNNLGCGSMLDSRFPISAGVPMDKMPISSWYTSNGGNGLEAWGSGDFGIRAMFVEDNAPAPGKHLTIKPPRLDFALMEDDTNMHRDQDYVIETWVYSTGTEAVTLNNIVIRAEVKDYLTFDPKITLAAKQIIPAGDSLLITVTCKIPKAVADSLNYTGNNLIQNNSADNINLAWRVWVKSWDEETVEDNFGLLPNVTALGQNYPNPFNPTTVLPISIASAGNVEVVLMDITGRVVMNVFNGQLTAGIHTFEINGGAIPAGVYLYRMNTANFSDTRKLLLLK